MKKIFIILVLIFLQQYSFSQSIGIGTAVPHTSAKLEVQSTNSGFLLPRLSTAQRNAITAPATGLIIFNINTAQFEFFNGTEWLSLSGGSGKWGNKQQYASESFASQALLFYKADGTGSGKYLGYDMAINNSILAAGAPQDFDYTGNITNLGSVRLFKRGNEDWKYYNVIYPEEQTAQSQFGAGVALDGNTLMVGAPVATVNGSFGRGKVYFYELDANGIPVFQNSVNALDPHAGDNYGGAVSASGNNAIVGASGYNVGPIQDVGAVYFLYKNNNVWSQRAVLSSPDGAEEDAFGRSVSMSGNYAAVAAPHVEINNLFRVGKVYIYQLINNIWTYTTTLITPNIAGMEKFGMDVHLKGDTLVVGASQFNGPIEGKAGKAYVYVRSGNNWNLQATLSPSDGKTGDAFGTSVYYNAGYIIVGAPYADVNANESQGKAYVFKMENGNWVEEAILVQSSGSNNDLFGSAVVIHPEVAASSSIHANYLDWKGHGRVYFFKR
jgi:hypothetical protein